MILSSFKIMTILNTYNISWNQNNVSCVLKKTDFSIFIFPMLLANNLSISRLLQEFCNNFVL